MSKWKCPQCDSRNGLHIYPRVRAKILLIMHSDKMQLIEINKDIVFELNDKAVCIKCSHLGKVEDFLTEEQAFRDMLPKIF